MKPLTKQIVAAFKKFKYHGFKSNFLCGISDVIKLIKTCIHDTRERDDITENLESINYIFLMLVSKPHPSYEKNVILIKAFSLMNV
jgi:hypothetical protein